MSVSLFIGTRIRIKKTGSLSFPMVSGLIPHLSPPSEAPGNGQEGRRKKKNRELPTRFKKGGDVAVNFTRSFLMGSVRREENGKADNIWEKATAVALF